MLYAAGALTVTGITPINHIARWDGNAWQALGDGLDYDVNALAVMDDGSGPALYAAGIFDTAGSMAAHEIARWKGTNWSAPGSGMTGWVFALATFSNGNNSILYAGGAFHNADSGSDDIAQWVGCPVPPSPWANLGFSLTGISGAPALDGMGPLTPVSKGALNLSHAAPSTPSMLFISLSSTPAPFKGGTLVPLPAVVNDLLLTSLVGSIPMSWSNCPPGLSGLSLHVQYAILDAAAIHGVALSNALRAEVP